MYYNAYPCYTRDDLYRQILSLGIDYEKALYYTEIIHKGKHNSVSKEEFEDFDIPEELKEVVRMYCYLVLLGYIIQNTENFIMFV